MLSKEDKKRHKENTLGRIAAFGEGVVEASNEDNLTSFGSRMRIWKQDPTIEDLKMRDIYIHTKVEDGPKDSQIEMVSDEVLSKDENGDFIKNVGSIKDQNVLHTYAVIRMVFTFYQRLLRKKLVFPWHKNGNIDPVKVFVDAGEEKNARYLRDQKAIKFYHFPSNGEVVFTCQSLDIAAHEAGHLVLDSLQPLWLRSPEIQTRAIHEALSDCTVLFLILSQFDLVEYIVVETKSNLLEPSILNKLAEQFGEAAAGKVEGLRNFANDRTMSDSFSGKYELSTVFSGAIYSILADLFLSMRLPRFKDDAITLYEANIILAKVLTHAIEEAPKQNAKFEDVGLKMHEIALRMDDRDLADIIQKHFEARKIFQTGLSAVTPEIRNDADQGWCSTTEL